MKQLLPVITVALILVLSIISCTPAAPQQPSQIPSSTQAQGTIDWNEAKYHIGERATVCGTVVDTKYGATSTGKPTWLNIGKYPPSPERFVVVIWGENRDNFPQAPDTIYYGKIVCITGLIQEYNGIPQIEVKYPSEIQVQ